MSVSAALKEQFELRIYLECIPRMAKCMSILSPEQIWHSHNTQSNSIGHLILHLCGNVTQWIGAGIGDRIDDRNRDLEFSNQTQFTSDELLKKLESLKSVTSVALDKLSDESLLTPCEVQGFKETYLSVVVHVIEHFSYHTGQVAIITKYHTGADLGFYADLDLNIKSE